MSGGLRRGRDIGDLGSLYPRDNFQPLTLEGTATPTDGAFRPGDEHPGKKGWYFAVRDAAGTTWWYRPAARWERAIFYTTLFIVCGAFLGGGIWALFTGWYLASIFLFTYAAIWWRIQGPRPPIATLDSSAGAAETSRSFPPLPPASDAPILAPPESWRS